MSEVALTRIARVSQWVRWMIALIFTIHVGGVVLAMGSSMDSEGNYKASIPLGEGVYTATVNSTRSDSPLGRALEAEGFSALTLLSSVDMVFYALLYALFFRLFGYYRQGRIFEDSNIRVFKTIGFCLLAWVVVDVVYPILLVLIIRWGGWSDSLAIYFSFGSSELKRLLIGAMVYVIGWIMAEAKTLQQEQELTI